MSDSSPILREPWPSVERQREGGAFGLWVFLASEVLFFGALLLSYTVYRSLYPVAFQTASHESNILYGSINTGLLLTSSFFMTVALHASQGRRRGLLLLFLLVTAALGFAFLAVKGLEYVDDLHKNLLPGPNFALHPPATRLFFALYWIMTGIHAIHLAIGIGATLVLTFAVWRRRVVPDTPHVEVTALYWHFVDTVWIILYALIYLPGRP